MRWSSASRTLAAVVVVASALSACTAAGTTSASRRASPSPASTPTLSPTSSSTPSPTPAAVTMGDVVSIQPARHGSFLVYGTYPRVRSRCVHPSQPKLKGRYPGRLTVRLEDDHTMTLLATLPFERYLEGIAEVPPAWPRAALEAQAIAARSYALASTGWQGHEGETLDRPICSTSSCQVYAGIPIRRTGLTHRWFQAVRRTRGEVLLFQGRPAITFYFSTSNGRTYDNEDVFGGSPLPYLRGIVEHDDGASPLSRWTTKLRYAELKRFLAHAGEWPAGQQLTAVHGDGSAVTVAGPGATRTIDGSTFRAAINEWAPCLEPNRFPHGGLPVTIPSRWMTIATTERFVFVTGRGWGHGIGMVQWGAYGKAQRGLSAGEILAAYYGGLRPQRFPEPGVIRVQIASGLTSLQVSPSGAARIGNEELTGPIRIVPGAELVVGFTKAG